MDDTIGIIVSMVLGLLVGYAAARILLRDDS